MPPTERALRSMCGYWDTGCISKPTALKKDVKYVERVRVEYRDSLVTKEIPVEVEVVKTKTPRWAYYLVLMNVLTVIALFIISYLRFKGKFKL